MDDNKNDSSPDSTQTRPGDKRKPESQGEQVAKKKESEESTDSQSVDPTSLYQRRTYLKPPALTDEEKILIHTVTTSCTDVDLIEKAIATRSKARMSCKLPEDLDDTSYYIERGLRKVYPYHYIYQCYSKRRWVGRKLADVLKHEFRTLTHEQLLKRFQLKHHIVNGKIADADYRLKSNDFICNITHRHELPVLATPIKIIHEDENFVVIDKPPSLPIHPCGRYRHNTILNVMKRDYNYTNLYVVHRLDRLVSGVLIFSRNSRNADLMDKQISGREVEKEYVCRVEGEFPEEEITVEKALRPLSRKIGITVVDDVEGKPSKTVFKRLSYNGVSSLVLCKPHTGRMHQIRVHLQYLGHPVVNDALYNSLAFGESKGKNGLYNKSFDTLLQDIIAEHKESNWIIPEEPPETEKGDTCGLSSTSDLNKQSWAHKPTDEERSITMKALKHYFTHSSWHKLQQKYKFVKDKIVKDPECFECGVEFADPPVAMLFLYLHALSYKGEGWSYKSDMPHWATANWKH